MDIGTGPVPKRPRAGLRLWHWSVIVLFVAVAIVNIQDQRITDRFLLGLACAGFVGYAVLAIVGWRYSRRLERRLGPLFALILYLIALAVLFIVASILFVAISDLYQFGTL
jgi:hypothetical protein